MGKMKFIEKLNIDDILEDEVPVKIEFETPSFFDNQIDDAKEDYRFLRTKMRFLMASGEYILNKSLISINNDQSPRTVEAASLILRNVVKISSEILSIHEKTKELFKEDKNAKTDAEDGKKKIKSSLVDIIKELKND
jgi:hypothetical protein